MNPKVKTFLLTLLVLGVVTIAMIELSGISTKSIFGGNDTNENALRNDPVTNEQIVRDSTQKAMPTTEMTFKENHFDFGKVKEGVKLKHTFEFTNTGEYPLYISDVKSPCGCTVPAYDKQPILPGKTGKIDLEFDSKGRPGKQDKKLTVLANIPSEYTFISFTTTVE